MRTPNIDLVQMADTTVARSNRDVFQLYIHVILSCEGLRQPCSSNHREDTDGILRGRTFKELAAVDLAGRDLEGNNMSL